MDKIIKAKKPRNRSRSLFLQGVYKTDCERMEDIFQNRLIANNNEPEKIEIYDKIPPHFYDTTSWKKSTNIPCWWCTRKFKTIPWFIPTSIEPNSKGDVGVMITSNNIRNTKNEKGVIIGVEGNTCCANCSRAWIDKNVHEIGERQNKIAMLHYLYELINGKKIPDIQPSPNPHTQLSKFGKGNLSESEYQKIIDRLDSDFARELENYNGLDSINSNVYFNGIDAVIGIDSAIM